MTSINLLPWREERRQRRQRQFVASIVAAVLLGAVSVVGAHLLVAEQIQGQQTCNQFLRSEIARLNRIAEEMKKLDETKARLLARLDIIQNLQTSRPTMVRIFDTLARIAPDTLYLSSLKTEGNNITLNGTALSNYVVSDFLRRLVETPLFGEPVLRQIDNRDIAGVRVSIFDLAVPRKSQPPAETTAKSPARSQK